MGSDETSPGAEGTKAAAGSFRLGETDYATPERLGEGLAENWHEGLAAFERGDLERWAREQLRDEELADAIGEHRPGSRETLAARYHRLIIRLNPGAAGTYMGYPLTEESLGSVAAKFEEPGAPQSAADAVRTIYQGRVLTAYAEATGTENLKELDDRWHREFEEFREIAEAVGKKNGPDVYGPLAWRTRAHILRALVQRDAMAALQERARAAERGPVSGRPWFQEGPNADEAGPGRLLATSLLAESPALQVELKGEADARSASRRKTIRRSVLGVIAAALVGWVVFAFVVGGEGPAAGGGPQGDGPTATGPVHVRVFYTGVVKEKADLLAEPDPGAEVVQPLEQLAVIEVIAEDNPDYYQVRLKDDQEVVGFLVKENVGIRCQGSCAVG